MNRRARRETANLKVSYRRPGSLSIAGVPVAVFFAASAWAFLSASAAAASPKGKASIPRPPLDFSGVWELDPRMSLNVSSHMMGAVLSVRQEGDRIWITPVKAEGGSRPAILAEEIVADAHPYEKALGPAGKGVVTAGWAADGKALWIEVLAGPSENPREAVQRIIWKLSEDRNLWVRESVSMSPGNAKSSRLVFRRHQGK